MSAFEEELQRRLDELERAHLGRKLRQIESAQGARVLLSGRSLLNFASNDYLSLANHPALKEASVRAIADFGAGSGASRLICGSLKPHHDLEEALAGFKSAEAALTFSTGYATAIGTICALLSEEDVIILDKLVHASIVDGAKLCGAKIRVFHHNDIDDLESILKWCAAREAKGRAMIVTESVFSMDGDFAPLREIVALKEKYGAWLMVDEAHATGIFGAGRRGCIELAGLQGQVEVQMGTLGKAVGASGGFIVGSGRFIDLLINKARSFIFSTAPVPAASAAARAGLEIIATKEGEKLRARLVERESQFANELGFPSQEFSPIYPLMIGDEAAAMSCAEKLLERGILAPAIRYPTVAKGKARIRFTFSAAHARQDVTELGQMMKDIRAGDHELRM